MNRIKLGALALTTALAITAGVTSLVAPQPAKAEAQSVNWSGRTRTLNIWPQRRRRLWASRWSSARDLSRTISHMSVGSGWKVTSQTASSFVLTNTSASLPELGS